MRDTCRWHGLIVLTHCNSIKRWHNKAPLPRGRLPPRTRICEAVLLLIYAITVPCNQSSYHPPPFFFFQCQALTTIWGLISLIDNINKSQALSGVMVSAALRGHLLQDWKLRLRSGSLVYGTATVNRWLHRCCASTSCTKWNKTAKQMFYCCWALIRVVLRLLNPTEAHARLAWHGWRTWQRLWTQ